MTAGPPQGKKGRGEGQGLRLRWRLAAAAALAICLAWGGGLAWFVSVASRPLPLPPRSDGIVALTGGASRIETALRLLAEDRGQRLLISGIGGNADFATLAHRAGVDPITFAARVTLDRAATTTHGNAIETEAWARANGIRSLIVITGYYHLPRALAELRRAMPWATLHPFPAQNPAEPGRRVPLRILVEEYTKYLAVVAGISGWLPTRDIPRPSQGPVTG